VKSYRDASFTAGRMRSWRETGCAEKGRRQLEQLVRSCLLFTKEQTGRRGGDGDWSKRAKRKRHRVVVVLRRREESLVGRRVIWQLQVYHMRGACRCELWLSGVVGDGYARWAMQVRSLDVAECRRPFST